MQIFHSQTCIYSILADYKRIYEQKLHDNQAKNLNQLSTTDVSTSSSSSSSSSDRKQWKENAEDISYQLQRSWATSCFTPTELAVFCLHHSENKSTTYTVLSLKDYLIARFGNIVATKLLDKTIEIQTFLEAALQTDHDEETFKLVMERLKCNADWSKKSSNNKSSTIHINKKKNVI